MTEVNYQSECCYVKNISVSPWQSNQLHIPLYHIVGKRRLFDFSVHNIL